MGTTIFIERMANESKSLSKTEHTKHTRERDSLFFLYFFLTMNVKRKARVNAKYSIFKCLKRAANHNSFMTKRAKNIIISRTKQKMAHYIESLIKQQPQQQKKRKHIPIIKYE